MGWKYGNDDNYDEDDDIDKQKEEWNCEKSYCWVILQIPPLVTVQQYFFTLSQSLQNPQPVTVQQYFCTLSHSQQSVQAATLHVKITAQKSPCMSFHWSGGTVTAVKHTICHSVHEYQHVSATSHIYIWHTQYHTPVCILRTAPHTDFIRLLPHCSVVSKWLPCWVLCISGDKSRNIHFIYRCLIYLYVGLNAKNFSKKPLRVGSVAKCRII